MPTLLERPVLIENVFITNELPSRKPCKTDYKQEKLALQDLAIQMVDHPADVLPHLVDLAIEICGAISGATFRAMLRAAATKDFSSKRAGRF